MTPVTRRATLLGTLAAPFVSRLARAAGEPIRIGTLTPQTGAGGALTGRRWRARPRRWWTS